MIRARLSSPTGEALLLGFDAEDIRTLLSGGTIYIDGATVGQKDDVAIIYGETVADIVNGLRDHGFPLPDVGEIKPGVEYLKGGHDS